MKSQVKDLSKYNAELKIILPVISLIIVNVFLFLLFKNYSYLIFIPIILSVYYIKNKYFKIYNLSYNTEYLFLKNKIDNRKISFKKINNIKLTLNEMKVMGNQHYAYQISFINENLMTETISFYISNLKSELWEFQNLVQNINEKVKINNSVKSWRK